MSKLVVLSGVPGSGKSYFSSLLKKVKRSHVYVISSDKLREIICGDRYSLDFDTTMWKMFYELAKVYSLDKDGTVILDATHAKVKFRVGAISDLIPLFDEVDLVMFKLDKSILDTQNILREYPVPQSVLDLYYYGFEDLCDLDKETFKNIYVINDTVQIPSIIDRL